ncbi:MAG: rod shape-determining protein RodA [Flavobacteriales bacterium]|nr:rod shape-determining protein RodA [Flavobacteriales bacterium]
MRNNRSLFANIDWTLVLLYLLMLFFGWLNIYAANYGEGTHNLISMSSEPGKQLFWIGTSFIWILLILILDGKFYTTFSYLIYAVMIILLIGVLIVGKEIGGAKSWYEIGNFSMQPSEFAKIGTLLALSKYLSQLNINLGKFNTQIKALSIIAIPILFIMLQPDAGSAIVFASLFLVLFREGISNIYLVIVGFAIALFVITLKLELQTTMAIVTIIAGLFAYLLKKNKNSVKPAIISLILALGFVQSVGYMYSEVLKPHQRNRIDLILGKIDDTHGAGYNLHQSKIAIGSGGFTGKGFLDGTQTKFNFVPEQSTDFIFCTIGEEWGFIGSIITIGIFMLLLFRLIILAERQRSAFSRVFGYGVATILFCHFFINIGMTIGIMPVIGIPLPFFSYGGSSLWGFSILLFIFIKLDAYRMEILR